MNNQTKKFTCLIAMIAVVVLSLSLTATYAQGNGKGGGKGGGNGGGGDGGEPAAWTVIDKGDLKLLSYDGGTIATLVSGNDGDLYAPEFSPDGEWIAYIQNAADGWSINRIRSDGSIQEEVCFFGTSSPVGPRWWSQLAWVPGEVDRIVYSGGNVGEFFVLSTIDVGLPVSLGLFGDGASLSPDREPETPGYQGAIAYSSGLLNVLLVEDTIDGLAVDEDSRQTYWSLGLTQRLPTWSNDGTEIAFLYGDSDLGEGGIDSGTTLCVLPVHVDSIGISLDESSLRIVSDHPASDIFFRPTWSPDDIELAYSVREDGVFKLYLTDSMGLTNPVRITSSRKNKILYPHWNPSWNGGSQ